ncbi:hypothetical protein [Nannocystis pusilla]|uniref:hypothetical protein n=1 Tax=Nannocystis pusilla TaxID=889268 RepID=UPI003BF5ED29
MLLGVDAEGSASGESSVRAPSVKRQQSLADLFSLAIQNIVRTAGARGAPRGAPKRPQSFAGVFFVATQDIDLSIETCAQSNFIKWRPLRAE